MKLAVSVLAAALTLLVSDLAKAQVVSQQTSRVGTFDSRIVALAYYRSPQGIERMKPKWDQELRDAEAAGDSARVEELKLLMPSFQHLMHQQVFSTGSICNVLREIEDDLPAIAAETGVSVIVSKWELPYHGPDIEVIDVTANVAALFETDEETARIVTEMANVEPVPLEEMLYQPEH